MEATAFSLQYRFVAMFSPQCQRFIEAVEQTLVKKINCIPILSFLPATFPTVCTASPLKKKQMHS